MYQPKEKIGKLTLLEPEKKGKGITWKCECECGKKLKIYQSRIKNGQRSCGCIKKGWHKNIKNKKYGKLTVIKQTEERYIDGSKCWITKCECGNKCLVKRSDFGIRKSCGSCHIDYSKIDISNTENDNWFILEKIKNKYKDAIYKAKCKYCDNYYEKPYYCLIYKQLKGCGCLRKQKILSNKNKKEFDEFKYNSIYTDYRKSAIKRGLQFDITKNELIEYIHKPCHYCGKSNVGCRKVGKYNQLYCNGIDRLDNNIGYIKDNCVPCCKNCNRMKNNMSIEDFKNEIKNIYNYLKLGEENEKN